jgi:lysozyme family protein
MAVAVYLKRYWEQPKINKIALISMPIAEEMFDTAVNMGTAWPPLFLQQALNGFNRQGRDYPDIAEDGDIGTITLTALSAYMRKRGKEGEAVMCTALNTLQGARYFAIVGTRRQNEDFLYGWIKNRVAL